MTEIARTCLRSRTGFCHDGACVDVCLSDQVRMAEDDPYGRLRGPSSCLDSYGTDTDRDCDVCPAPSTCQLVPHSGHRVTSTVCSRRVLEKE